MSRVLMIASLPSSISNFRGPLLKTMIARGHDLYAAAPFKLATASTVRAIDALGVKRVNISLDRGSLNPIRDLFTLYSLYRTANTLKPEWIIAYTIKPVIWGCLAAKFARVPKRAALITGLGYAFTGRARGKRVFLQKIAKMLYRFSLSQSDLVFFQNSDDRRLFETLDLLHNVRKVLVINGSGVDLKHFPSKPMPTWETSIRFLLVARLLRDKGVGEYIAAARIVRAKFPTAEFHLVGDVDSNPDSFNREEVKSWHDSGDVIWHGHLDDVRTALAQCHVYVLPSYREGTPRSVLEAMATGRPIITTDAPGCRETVTEGLNGYLVPVRDAEALAKAMMRYCAEPNGLTSMGAASLKIAREKYDVHKVNAVMLEAMGL